MNKLKQALKANQSTLLAYENFKLDIAKYYDNQIKQFETKKAKSLEKIKNKLYFKTIKKNTRLEEALKTKQRHEDSYKAKLDSLKIAFQDLQIDQASYDEQTSALKTKYEKGRVFETEYLQQVVEINNKFATTKQKLTNRLEIEKQNLTAKGNRFHNRQTELKTESLADLERKKDLIIKANDDNVVAIAAKIKNFKSNIASQKQELTQKQQAQEIGIHTYKKQVAKLDDKVASYQAKMQAQQVKYKPLVLNKQILTTKFNRLLNENSDRHFLSNVVTEIGDFISKNKIIFIVLLLLFYTSLMNRNFWSLDSLKLTMKGSSEVILMALAITMVILTGGIDLSVGSIMAFAAVTMLKLAGDGLNMHMAILLGILFSAMVGLVQGALIGYGRMVPFVVTLGGLLIFRGAAILYADSKPIIATGQGQKILEGLSNSEFLGLNVQIWIVLIAFLVFFLVLKFTVFGRQIYAVGSNRRAAFLSGVRDKRIEMFVYALSGMMAGLAGMLIAARTQSIQPNQGQAWELKAIAAVVIGGTALTGGRGGVIGTFVGWIILSMMPTLFTTLGYSTQIEKIATGIIIIVAVLFNNNLDFKGGLLGIRDRVTKLCKHYFTARRI